MNITQSHVKRVYNIDSTVIYPAIEKRKIEKKKPKHFFYVGRIEKYKNIENAILALNELVKIKKYQAIKFFIAGNGSNKKNIENLTNRLGLNKNIVFLGFISDEEKFEYLSESYALLMPAFYEPFGLTAVEAFSAHTTVIMSENSGVSEIAHGSFLDCDVLDYNSICNSMIELIENKALRENLIKMGKNTIEKNALYIEDHVNKLLTNMTNS